MDKLVREQIGDLVWRIIQKHGFPPNEMLEETASVIELWHNAKVEELIEMGDRMMEMLSHADFSNGNEAFGMDEGRVRGYEMMKGIETDWQGLKSKYTGGSDGQDNNE